MKTSILICMSSFLAVLLCSSANAQLAGQVCLTSVDSQARCVATGHYVGKSCQEVEQHVRYQSCERARQTCAELQAQPQRQRSKMCKDGVRMVTRGGHSVREKVACIADFKNKLTGPECEDGITRKVNVEGRWEERAGALLTYKVECSLNCSEATTGDPGE